MVKSTASALLASVIVLLCWSAVALADGAISARLDSMEAFIMRDALKSQSDTGATKQISGNLLRDKINQAQEDVAAMWPQAIQRRWTGTLDSACSCVGLDTTFRAARSVILQVTRDGAQGWLPLSPGEYSFLRDSTGQPYLPKAQTGLIRWYSVNNDTIFVHPRYIGSSGGDTLLIVFGYAYPLPLTAGADKTTLRPEFRSAWRERSAYLFYNAIEEFEKAAVHKGVWDEFAGKQTKTTVTQESVQ